MPKGIFNGHTWIVILISVIGLNLMGLGALTCLTYLLATSSSDQMRALEAIGIPTIPITVVKGIELIVKRLTYIPDIDTTETMNTIQNKE